VGRKTPGLPCAMVGRLMPGSPGSRTFPLASLAPRIDDAVRPVGLAHISAKGLTVATTARTTRFCRTLQRRSSARGCGLTGTTRPALSLSRTTLPRPPHPNPRSLRRTIAPLLGPGWADSAAIPNFGKVEYFRGEGLTGFCTMQGCFARRVKLAHILDPRPYIALPLERDTTNIEQTPAIGPDPEVAAVKL